MKLDVVFTIDRGYIQHFCVALTSLLENNKNIVGRVFLVVSKNFNEKWIDGIISFALQSYGKEIELRKIDDSLLTAFKVDKHISIATYFRIFIPDVLPQDLNQILFLDSDIVINGDISGILDYQFNQPDYTDEYFAFAADHLFKKTDYERLKPLGLTADSYFNAGVLWMNLNLFRQENISQKAVDFINKNNDQLIFWDQDVLNVMFDGKYGCLDLKYNGFEQALQHVKNPLVIHYTGSLKPWHYSNKHPFKYLYWEYLGMTPFKAFRYTDKSLKTIVERYSPDWAIKLFKAMFKRNQ